MLDDIRTRLKRKGMLSAVNVILGNQPQRDLSRSSLSEEAQFMKQMTHQGVSNQSKLGEFSGVQNNNQNRLSGTQNDTILTGVGGQSSHADLLNTRNLQQKSFFIRNLRNLLSSTLIELEDTDINFYLYQEQGDQKSGNSNPASLSEEDMQLDFQNIKKFHKVLNSRHFLEKNLCFRLHFPNGEMKVKAISDEDLDLSIKGKQCLILNPCFQHK